MPAQPKKFFDSVALTMGGPLLSALPECTAVVFDLRGDGGGVWTVARNGDDLDVREGQINGPDCFVVCSVEDFSLLATGELSPLLALQDGRLTVEGDVGIVLALRDVVAEQLRQAS
ncbi:MAG: SCP2 sterol-binding domain-containing protein [Deltaproteobacteria bacterium]|nr:MAG: SCP2 sterol-binding domain-containing protein [Deltaproteobacteria bacterium]